MSDAREQLEEIVEKAIQENTDYDPNGLDSIVGRVVDALLKHGPNLGAGWYRAGWLLAYGRVHEVVETDMQDSVDDGCSYLVYTVRKTDEEDEG